MVCIHSFTKSSALHIINKDLQVHGHNGANTFKPFYVINCLRDNAAGDVQVPCSDTDVFILSMNLAAIGHVVAHVTIINGVDYGDRNKSRALIRLHNFTENNWRR